MFGKKTALEKEWAYFLKRERKAVERYSRPGEPFLEKRLRTVVPEGLQEKLELAFYKAFQTIFENGTGVIERTYSREKLEAEYETRAFAAKRRPVRKTLSAGRREAAGSQAAGVAGAAAEGAFLGILGIGLPDIPLFLAVVLRSLYTQALRFGIDYEKPEEQEFLLELLAVSLERGDDFAARDAAVNRRAYRLEEMVAESSAAAAGRGVPSAESSAAVAGRGVPSAESSAAAAGRGVSAAESGAASPKQKTARDAVVRRAAAALSGELLYMKFLQGIPIAGVIGGLSDGICLKRITDYAVLKLERRWLLRQQGIERREVR